MVVTQLLGGLGNQLFQYAVGRALAHANGVRLKLDVSAFGTYRLRPYALKPFKIEADVLTPAEARALGVGRPAGAARTVWHRLTGRPRIPVVAEASFEFDPAVLHARPPCYLKGYWQSPRYFQHMAELIRSELAVAGPLSDRNRALTEQIRSTVAVSVHVRRGDYVSDSQTNRYHGSCEPDYYREAERLLRARVGDMQLYVFSDDPQWARDNLSFSSPAVIVSHNGPERPEEDLRLMTLCRHHIIANSTFSWWGAWLCPQADKLVVAPKQWFRAAAHRTGDLLPSDWITL
jgi:hypothetical protein